MISSCDEFPEGSRMRSLCEGTADLPLHKINGYRKNWGLPALTATNRPSIVPKAPKHQRTVEPRVHRSKPPARQPRAPVVRRKHVIPARTRKGLGDHVESALTAVGITSERVEKWLGRPCGCKARKAKLNKLSDWVSSVVTGTKAEAVERLEEMINK